MYIYIYIHTYGDIWRLTKLTSSAPEAPRKAPGTAPRSSRLLTWTEFGIIFGQTYGGQLKLNGIPTNPNQPNILLVDTGWLGWWNSQYMEKTKHVPNHHANIFVRPPKNNNDLHHHLVKGAQNEAVFLKLGQHVHQLELGILRHRKMA